MNEPPTERRSPLARAWPLLLILTALAAAYALGLHRELTFESLAARQSQLRAWIEAHGVLAPVAYGLAYAAAVALSLPGAVVMTMAGGLLFGTILGATAAILGATTGAILVFLAARYALADWLAARFGGLVARIRPGLERDGFSYLVALRLLPLLPFWLVNLAPALVGMKLRTFALATGLGIIPGSFVFASVGAGIGGVLAEGQRPDLSIILRPSVLIPLLGLALLALAPVARRHWKARRGSPIPDATDG